MLHLTHPAIAAALADTLYHQNCMRVRFLEWKTYCLQARLTQLEHDARYLADTCELYYTRFAS
jgi:hypothetical protein